MNNKQKVISYIDKLNDSILNDEIEYYLSIDREYKADKADALDHILDIAEHNQEKSIIRKCRIVLIGAGGYCIAHMNMCINGDVRFQHNGKKYDWPHPGGWEWWINQ